jgi:hypothetical protein
MELGIPKTAAFVPWGAKYRDSNVQRWLGRPRNVERRFARRHGKFIPENYLALFQDDLVRIHQEIIHVPGGHGLLEFRAMLFYLKVFFNIGNLSVLMLKEVYFRPCAEGYKLFKILLFQLARICVAYRCDLYVENPLAVTEAVLEKAFSGAAMERPVERFPHLGPVNEGRADYMIVRYRNLRRLDLARCFDMMEVLLLPSFAQAEPWIIPPIVCNASRFPPCDVLNFGPRGSQARTDGEKRAAGALREYSMGVQRLRIPDLKQDMEQLYAETSVLRSPNSSFSMNAGGRVAEQESDVSGDDSEPTAYAHGPST